MACKNLPSTKLLAIVESCYISVAVRGTVRLVVRITERSFRSVDSFPAPVAVDALPAASKPSPSLLHLFVLSYCQPVPPLPPLLLPLPLPLPPPPPPIFSTPLYLPLYALRGFNYAPSFVVIVRLVYSQFLTYILLRSSRILFTTIRFFVLYLFLYQGYGQRS